MSDVLFMITNAGAAGYDNAHRAAQRFMLFEGGYLFVSILAVAAMIFAMVCSARVKSTFNKYSTTYNRKHLTAWQVARQILDNNGLYDVSVVHISGNLTDNFNPKTKVVSLSDSVYDSSSLAAIGVAAHECGHAIQHAKGYTPIKIRSAFVPIVQIGSRTYIWIFLLGLLLNNSLLANVGIILFAFVVIFQLVTIPVEFNASSRALKTLSDQLILDSDELAPAKKTLSAAAMTYVASLLVSVTQLLKLLVRSRRR